MKPSFASVCLSASPMDEYCGFVLDCVCSSTFMVSNGWPLRQMPMPAAVPAAMSIAASDIART